MKLPLKQLKLGHKEFSVRDFVRTEDPRYKGFHYKEIAQISLNLRLIESNTDLINTLLHEIMHAIWDANGLSQEDEEQHVELITNSLIELFQRNPQFVRLLHTEFVS